MEANDRCALEMVQQSLLEWLDLYDQMCTEMQLRTRKLKDEVRAVDVSVDLQAFVIACRQVPGRVV